MPRSQSLSTCQSDTQTRDGGKDERQDGNQANHELIVLPWELSVNNRDRLRIPALQTRRAIHKLRTPRRFPAGASLSQAADTCSSESWRALMMSAATCWIRSKDAASVSVLPS